MSLLIFKTRDISLIPLLFTDILIIILLVSGFALDRLLDRIKIFSKKTSSWLWHAINHDNGDVVAYVIGSRHHDMLWQLTDLIYSLNLNITAVYSDDNFAYHDVIPFHTLHTGKINTQKIERKHLSFALALNA